ncbi:MAG: hypothetical protein H5T50_00745 [Nitrososphaeria archaeon]|nr:hypothetical protein [Nitrososphaeria archaeon]
MIYVLDATAFIFGFLPAKSFQLYTTDDVVKEAVKNKFSKLKIDTLISQGVIKVISPPKRYILEVEKKAFSLSELKLSKADKSIIALSLYLRDEERDQVVIVTDDYSLQNVASTLGIKFKSLTVKGITKKIEWILYCPACGKSVKETKESFCPICGHKMKRKPKRFLQNGINQ